MPYSLDNLIAIEHKLQQLVSRLKNPSVSGLFPLVFLILLSLVYFNKWLLEKKF